MSDPKQRPRQEPSTDKYIARRCGIDPPPWANDGLEAVVVVVMLGCMGTAAWLLYLISERL